MPGILTISLDFELHWGGFEKWPLHNSKASNTRYTYNQYFLNTRKAIPEMLELFEQYDAHVTWATVGMLFNESKKQLYANAPDRRPSYVDEKLSAYHYIDSVGIGDNETDDPFHFAPSLIKMIIATPNQELGSHTYAHFYCNEAGQTVDQFRADLGAAQKAAAMFEKKLSSLVFPRNQFNDAYLKACYAEGIRAVRSNPLDWFWHIDSTQNESSWKRLNRGVDAYFPLGKHNTYKLESIEYRDGFPICIPASRLLRPYRPKELFLNDFKINRIKSEMTRAAGNGEIYHLWWHPHNFGNFPAESIAGLKKILRHYQKCRQRFGMTSMNMGEIASQRVRN